MSSLSKSDWKKRLEPALSESTEAARRVLTNHPEVQSWLQSAAFEMAMGLVQQGDVEASAAAYGELLQDLRTRFAELVDAVLELTEGCGSIDVDWRPLTPNYSSVYIRFHVPFEVDVFVRLDSLSDEDVRNAVERVAKAVARGMPYPGHPNAATGLLAYDGACLGVRILEHNAGGGVRRRTVSLLSREAHPVEDLTPEDAVRGVKSFFERFT